MGGRAGPGVLVGEFLAAIVLTMLSVKVAEFLRETIVVPFERRSTFLAIQPWVYLIVLAIWLFFFLLLGVYDPRRRSTLINDLGNLWLAITLSMLVLASIFYLLALQPPAAPSRLFYAYLYILDLAALTALELAVANVLVAVRRRGHQLRRVLLVGSGVRARHVAVRLRDRERDGIVLAGYVPDRAGEPLREFEPAGNVTDVAQIVRDRAVDEVVMALPAEEHEAALRLASDLQELDVDVRVLPDLFEMVAMKARVDDFYGLPLISVTQPSITPVQARIKRAFDLVVAGILLVLLSPLLAAIAIWVRLDSRGPIVIRQERVGAGGKTFRMLKFRTMNWKPEELDRAHPKRAADPRITRVGRRLRRTSLDELPQLWNVIKGDMSLVGPRPELPAIVESYEPWQWKRFVVPPGMTGWWQVNGRSERSMHLNTEIDLFYVQNYSILLDLRILARTVGAVIKGRGAY
ncbi:MAG TPA: sugar transferase [Chloroflexota bacterium]|nr:sugar transferase [Chloroflexota bacterium]